MYGAQSNECQPESSEVEYDDTLPNDPAGLSTEARD